jgi:hypothetical protein
MDAKFSVATAMISEPPEPSHFAGYIPPDKIAEITDEERDLLVFRPGNSLTKSGEFLKD